jgi:hypothetical protein
VERPEDKTRTVDEEKMIAFVHGCMDSAAILQGPYKVRAEKGSASPNCYQFVTFSIFAFP